VVKSFITLASEPMPPLGANVTKQYRGKLPQHSFMTLSRGSNLFLNNTVVSQNHNNIVLKHWGLLKYSGKLPWYCFYNIGPWWQLLAADFS
jgi:hypothetical protein